jgi:hypothetical protein
MQNQTFYGVKTDGTYSNHCGLKGLMMPQFHGYLKVTRISSSLNPVSRELRFAHQITRAISSNGHFHVTRPHFV